jgi:hypothetical protein
MSSELLLQKLQEINKKTVNVFIPSLGREVAFKPLNIKQQKEIIKASFDKNIPGISFNTILNNIITQNCAESGASFLVTDRPAIAIALRKDIFGSTIKNAIKADSLDEEKGEYNIDEIVNLKLALNFEAKKELIVDTLTVGIKIPTLNTDNKINKECQKNLSHLVDQNNSAKDIISELFVYEIVKFIEYIEITDAGKAIFKDMPVSSQLQLLESLTADINKQVLDYIEEVRNFEKKYLSFTKNNVEYTINLDAAFFNNE